jgi:hypothetical protein
MKRFMNKKVLVVGVAVAVFLGVGGAAFAFFTSTGSGTGSAQTGTSVPLVINQLGTPAYNSTVSPLPGSMVSHSFEATGTNELGNQIALASTSAPLSNVVVTMESWGCENWAAMIATPSTLCASTPGDTFPATITFNIFKVGANNALGSLIATDTPAPFNIPFRPSANPANCTGGAWYNNAATAAAYGVTADNACHNGLANNITFDFSSQGIVLPSKVIYGIAYSTGSNPNGGNGAATGPIGSLNVALSTEPTQPTVGSDPLTGTGSDYINITNANGGGYYPNYCDNGVGGENTGFRYDPAPCSGADAINHGATTTWYIPAVQFNVGIGDLYPGGAAQPINFSVTNPGGGNEQVQNVTITVATDPSGYIETVPGDSGSGVTGCYADWFTISGSPVAVNQNVPGGGTIDWTGAASISMMNEPFSQDACQGKNVVLNFTSN